MMQILGKCQHCGRDAYYIAMNSKLLRCEYRVTKCPSFIAKGKQKRYASLSKEELSQLMSERGKVGNLKLVELHTDPDFVKEKGLKISNKISESGGRLGVKNFNYGKIYSQTSKDLMSIKAKARPQSFYDNNLKKRIENGHIVPSDSKDSFAVYKDEVYKLTRRSWIKYHSRINPNNLKRGKEYELDHIFSIVDGFNLKIPANIISHWTNLQMLDQFTNRSKHSTSHKKVNELWEHYNREEQCII